MLRKSILSLFLAAVMTVSAGCSAFSGRSSGGLPYPDGWVITENPETEEDEAGTNSTQGEDADNESTDSEDAAREEAVREDSTAASDTPAGLLPPIPMIYYYFDTSGSMKRYPASVYVHAAAQKAGAGMDRIYCILDRESKLVKVDEAFALSGKFENKAVLDVLGTEEIPLLPNGVNVFTTDLQSDTLSSEIGKWLANSGCGGFSFYVFSLSYGGSVDFYTYTSNAARERVYVKNCSFSRDYLMIVCGDDSLVRGFDSNFQDHLRGDAQEELPYDFCHVSLSSSTAETKSLLPLTPSRSFTDDLPNVFYDGTFYLYGLMQDLSDEVKNTGFTLENTFVFRRNKHSANEKKTAARILLYAVPKTALPEITGQEVTVLQYDSKKKAYVASDLPFTVKTEAFLDSLPAALDPSQNEKLGGCIVPPGTPVFAVTIENPDLPSGLYAISVTLPCSDGKGARGFREFARDHSAGLEAYTSALNTECQPLSENGKTSRTRYLHTETGNSVYSRLLEFERIADELIAAGYTTEATDDVIALRAVINF